MATLVRTAMIGLLAYLAIQTVLVGLQTLESEQEKYSSAIERLTGDK